MRVGAMGWCGGESQNCAKKNIEYIFGPIINHLIWLKLWQSFGVWASGVRMGQQCLGGPQPHLIPILVLHTCALPLCTRSPNSDTRGLAYSYIVLLILKFNYQVFIFTPYSLFCSAHAPNKYHTTHTCTHTKPHRLHSLMALVVLHIYVIFYSPHTHRGAPRMCTSPIFILTLILNLNNISPLLWSSYLTPTHSWALHIDKTSTSNLSAGGL